MSDALATFCIQTSSGSGASLTFISSESIYVSDSSATKTLTASAIVVFARITTFSGGSGFGSTAIAITGGSDTSVFQAGSTIATATASLSSNGLTITVNAARDSYMKRQTYWQYHAFG